MPLHRIITSCLMAGAVLGADKPVATPFLSTISGEVIHANTIELPRLTFSDVVAFPVMTGQILRLSDVRAQAYGGIITGSVSIDLRDLKSQIITTQLIITDLDLGLFASAWSPTAAEVAGKVNGTLELTIPTDRPEAMTGRGDIAIRNGALVEMSWFTSILMGDTGKNRGQDSAVGQFEIGNGQWIINNLHVQFANAQVRMQGSISFEGEMNMQVSPQFGSFLGLVPFIGRLFDRATGALTSKVARGVLRGPVSKPVWLYRPFGE